MKTYENIEAFKKANPNAPEPDSHFEDMEAFGECRKCWQNDLTYMYFDCPNFSQEVWEASFTA